jgi:hypothetical protein
MEGRSMITNKLGLPEALVRAVSNDPYTRGSSDISVTQMIQPPYRRKLQAEHEVDVDASERIYALLGQAVHHILERAYPDAHVADNDLLGMAMAYQRWGVLREQRLFAAVKGWKVSGAFDVLEKGILKDYKVTSVWSVKGDVKTEWTQQLNLLRVLAHYNGLKVTGLQIIAILRDWQRVKAQVDKTYPQFPVAVVDVEMWPLADAEEYLIERVIEHQLDEPEPCTDEERWKTEDVFAVMKEGRKSAVKLFDVREEAEARAKELGKGHSVVQRPGEYRRCMDYCEVNVVCEQFKSEVPF